MIRPTKGEIRLAPASAQAAACAYQSGDFLLLPPFALNIFNKAWQPNSEHEADLEGQRSQTVRGRRENAIVGALGRQEEETMLT